MKNLKTIFLLLAMATAIFALTNCNKEEEICKAVTCGGTGEEPLVDLIILIDCSLSMSITAQDISDQADSALQVALQSCPSDLRVEWFGQAGTWPGTKFTQNYQTYLTGLGFTPIPAGNEQGAIGIQDLSNNYDWREGACRAIFYISDEPINQAWDSTNNHNEANNAILEANKNSVTVSAHFQTYMSSSFPWALKNYQDVTAQTGGQLFTSLNLPPNYYSNNSVFDNLVCNACNNCQIDIKP